jgi:hypothetical protein
MLSQRQSVVGRLLKKKIRHFYKQGEIERNRDYARLENHYYECTYDTIAQNIPSEEKLPRLNRLKANIVKMHSARLQAVMLDTHQTDRMDDEHPQQYTTSYK